MLKGAVGRKSRGTCVRKILYFSVTLPFKAGRKGGECEDKE